MKPDQPMKDEDEVTVAASSDVLAQIREQALAIKRERTGEDADVIEEVVVWSANANGEADVAVPSTPDFDPSLDKTSVLQPRTTRPAPASTVSRYTDDGESLIGSALPPPSSATYFESSDTTATKPPSAAVRLRSRRRVPTWLLVLVAALMIVGLSVAIALLVASGSST